MEKVIKVDRSSAVKAYNNIAIIQTNIGRDEAAAESLKKAIKLNEQINPLEDMSPIEMNLAMILQKLARTHEANEYFDRAVKSLQKSIDIEPNNGNLYNRLGDTFASQGKFTQASEAFKKAVFFEPNDVSFYENLAAALELDGKIQQAMDELKAGIAFFESRKNLDKAIYLRKIFEDIKKRTVIK